MATKIYRVVAGQTSFRAQIWIRDSGVSYDRGLAGLVYNSVSIEAYYIRDGETSATAITLASATVGTWSTGGFKQIDPTHLPGMYEVGIPNAVIASGAKRATVFIQGAANMIAAVLEFELLGNDPYSAAFSSGANDGIASAVGAMAVETGVSVIQMLRAIGAVAAGNYTDSTKVFEAVGAATTTRVTTALSSNNRTNTLNL